MHLKRAAIVGAIHSSSDLQIGCKKPQPKEESGPQPMTNPTFNNHLPASSISLMLYSIIPVYPSNFVLLLRMDLRWRL